MCLSHNGLRNDALIIYIYVYPASSFRFANQSVIPHSAAVSCCHDWLESIDMFVIERSISKGWWVVVGGEGWWVVRGGGW